MIFLNDIKNLPDSVSWAFAQGHLLADRVFSYTEIGQPHEQNNKVVKVDGEANDISESKRMLFEWALSGPYIDGMIRK